MKNKQPKTKRLKAWLVSYTIGEGESQETKSVAVFGYDKEEVGDVFIKWAQATGLYNRIGGVVAQPMKKTKGQTQSDLEARYTKQNAGVNELYINYVNNRKVDA